MRLIYIPYLHNIVHQANFEHPVQFNSVIFQNILKGSFRAILRQNAAMWRIHAGSVEPRHVIVFQILHLL